MNETDTTCDKCGKPMAVREGRFGQFMACTGYPECNNTLQRNQAGGFKEPSVQKPTNETCDKCGKPMVEKNGRFGPFTACSGYPDCRNIKNIEQKTGVTCPQCSKGDIVAKRSRKGKTFYSCNKYPDCKFALWQKPTGEKCPDCSSLITQSSAKSVKCSNKECKFQKEI